MGFLNVTDYQQAKVLFNSMGFQEYLQKNSAASATSKPSLDYRNLEKVIGKIS
jgi:hypothetical protein